MKISQFLQVYKTFLDYRHFKTGQIWNAFHKIYNIDVINMRNR